MNSIILNSSAGRRPARMYFRNFLAKGDEIRAIVRMRQDMASDLWRLIRRRGYAKGVDRRTNTPVRRYVHAPALLSEFLGQLPDHLTRLDRYTPRQVAELKLSRAAYDQLGFDEATRRSNIQDEFVWEVEDAFDALQESLGNRVSRRGRRIHYSDIAG
uniref:Uncharacterized protein n=1 Tax=Red panda circovirus 4 TaxID=2863953 RepID=A0A8K1HHB0_9CIRC|nr:hypothetical protein [Red panda circovirus 4]